MANLKTFFGSFSPPPGVAEYESGVLTLDKVGGLTLLFSNILRIIIYGGVLFTLINLLISGIQYLGSSGSPETIKQASARIWMSLLGLVIIACSIILAAIIGLVFFGDATLIIKPVIPTP